MCAEPERARSFAVVRPCIGTGSKATGNSSRTTSRKDGASSPSMISTSSEAGANSRQAAAAQPLRLGSGQQRRGRLVYRKTLRQLSDVSSQIRTTSSDLSMVSRQTDKRVEVAQKASEETSMSVDNVVAASKKLSASINDISQRSAHGAGIASCAIDRRHSAGPCQIGMADRRGRRPDQTIAAQTNLRRSTPASRRPARARRTRLCCRRLRGEVAGEPDRQGRRRDFRADRRH
jgi:hypothetical protein